MSAPSIALTGRLRSGKDSVARYLGLGYGYARFAFGDELKRYYNELFGETETKPREGYQWFGQTMRQRDPDVWVRKCFEDIENFRRSYFGVSRPTVITDLRQPNEYDRCRAEGYVIIRVNAPESLRINRAVESADTFKYADLRHETESHVDSFEVDYEIDNVGTLLELYEQVGVIMAKLTERDR